MRTQPILSLADGEEVRTMFRDEATGVVLVGTSQGRILCVRRLASNAHLAGNRTIYATRTNGVGEESPIASANVRYGLLDRIAEVASDMSIVRWKEVARPTGAESSSTASGVFTTPILWAGEDFGWWGDVSWSQSVDGGRVVVAIRVSSSEEGLLAAPWRTTERTSSGAQAWQIDELSTADAYAQMRVVLESSSPAGGPSVSALALPYHSRHASYFFLTKLSMLNGTSIRGGMLTASFVAPRNTEVKWGVAGSNSADWRDFTAVTPDRLFELADGFGDRLKVGVKMLSYDDDHYPSVDEFAVAFDSDVDNLVNRG